MSGLECTGRGAHQLPVLPVLPTQSHPHEVRTAVPRTRSYYKMYINITGLMFPDIKCRSNRCMHYSVEPYYAIIIIIIIIIKRAKQAPHIRVTSRFIYVCTYILAEFWR